MAACDTLFSRRYAEYPVRPWPGRSRRENAEWEAMILLNPSLSLKTNLTYEQMENDKDFKSTAAVRKALTRIATDCEILLTDLQKDSR